MTPQVNRRGMGGAATVCGRRFPAGTQFLLNFRAVAWDETLWPEPMKFRPERFEGPAAAAAAATAVVSPRAGSGRCLHICDAWSCD
jgi:cytochrome P450